MTRKLIWKDWCYVCGVAMVQIGAVLQIIKTYTTQSAGDIAFFWIVLLLVGETFHLPLAFSSHYLMWKLAHIFAICLICALLAGVTIYD